MIQPSLVVGSQYLGAMIKEVFNLHMGWFGFQIEPLDDVITDVSAFGYCLEIILHTCGEDLLCLLVDGALGSAQVPFGK